ncbi:hypothetical protein NKW55_15880 [Gluconobacter kondonii]|uniref:Helix-turn-helix domain-containing protein n=1 Tax=Gluconobacter kondonii TaxID=941463 RepID=A0ABQ5WWN6_9PROT|nr:hypothetical protein [Gluconobacter kondonii]MCP1238014.1 hypothetical protein [Gluconobacter kondonii]GBR35419.1 hypothetical protein AA3266_2146 [Gluconobacter kondonii NBRC 3266]GLQ67457.1 hypothetical protein GCM10007870_30420 [Gluconobacter kondonii]
MQSHSRDFPQIVPLKECPIYFGFSAATATRLVRQGDIQIARLGKAGIVTASVREMIKRKIRAAARNETDVPNLGTLLTQYHDLPALLHMSHVERHFHFSRSTAYCLAKQRHITTIKIGTARLVVVDLLLVSLQQKTVVLCTNDSCGSASGDSP